MPCDLLTSLTSTTCNLLKSKEKTSEDHPIDSKYDKDSEVTIVNGRSVRKSSNNPNGSKGTMS